MVKGRVVSGMWEWVVVQAAIGLRRAFLLNMIGLAGCCRLVMGWWAWRKEMRSIARV